MHGRSLAFTVATGMVLFSWGCASVPGGGDECCSASAAQAKAAAACDKPGPWISLFDGRTLSGWRNWGSPTISTGWQVQDGALARMSEGAGNIITERQFGNFDLEFEWKVAPGANSGVFFHVAEGDDLGLITSPEYQILDDERHPDGGNPTTSAGANYALHAPSTDAARPPGQWNKSRILVIGDHVEHHLNGTKIVEYELGSEDWKQRVAASKFAKWPAYGTRRRGHIALQDHGDPVWYRNIRIREFTGCGEE